MTLVHETLLFVKNPFDYKWQKSLLQCNSKWKKFWVWCVCQLSIAV